MLFRRGTVVNLVYIYDYVASVMFVIQRFHVNLLQLTQAQATCLPFRDDQHVSLKHLHKTFIATIHVNVTKCARHLPSPRR